MEATSIGALNFPKFKQPKIKVETATTVFGGIVIDFTPSPVSIALPEEPEYSDEQFHADLGKASSRLDAAVSKALKEHAQGKTRKFPV